MAMRNSMGRNLPGRYGNLLDPLRPLLESDQSRERCVVCYAKRPNVWLFHLNRRRLLYGRVGESKAASREWADEQDRQKAHAPPPVWDFPPSQYEFRWVRSIEILAGGFGIRYRIHGS